MVQSDPYDALGLFTWGFSRDISGENQRADGWCEGDSILADLRSASTPDSGQAPKDWFGHENGIAPGLNDSFFYMPSPTPPRDMTDEMAVNTLNVPDVFTNPAVSSQPANPLQQDANEQVPKRGVRQTSSTPRSLKGGGRGTSPLHETHHDIETEQAALPPTSLKFEYTHRQQHSEYSVQSLTRPLAGLMPSMPRYEAVLPAPFPQASSRDSSNISYPPPDHTVWRGRNGKIHYLPVDAVCMGVVDSAGRYHANRPDTRPQMGPGASANTERTQRPSFKRKSGHLKSESDETYTAAAPGRREDEDVKRRSSVPMPSLGGYQFRGQTECVHVGAGNISVKRKRADEEESEHANEPGWPSWKKKKAAVRETVGLDAPVWPNTQFIPTAPQLPTANSRLRIGIRPSIQPIVQGRRTNSAVSVTIAPTNILPAAPTAALPIVPPAALPIAPQGMPQAPPQIVHALPPQAPPQVPPQLPPQVPPQGPPMTVPTGGANLGPRRRPGITSKSNIPLWNQYPALTARGIIQAYPSEVRGGTLEFVRNELARENGGTPSGSYLHRVYTQIHGQNYIWKKEAFRKAIELSNLAHPNRPLDGCRKCKHRVIDCSMRHGGTQPCTQCTAINVQCN